MSKRRRAKWESVGKRVVWIFRVRIVCFWVTKTHTHENLQHIWNIIYIYIICELMKLSPASTLGTQYPSFECKHETSTRKPQLLISPSAFCGLRTQIKESASKSLSFDPPCSNNVQWAFKLQFRIKYCHIENLFSILIQILHRHVWIWQCEEENYLV